MKVRDATAADAEAIAELLAELGYTADKGEVAGRIERLAGSDTAGVLVVDDGGATIALLAFHLIELLERPQSTCRITALVVAHSHRRRGAATELLAALRHLAIERRSERLEVTTKPEREDALAFYRAHGFDERPRRLVSYLGG
jgi:ribosomal protein S18 acetylase RimI-like enzyme